LATSPRLTSAGWIGDVAARAVSWSAGAGAALAVERRWRTPIETAPHGLPGRLVVSLTSYGPRLSSLHLSLKCLLHQSIRPDAIVLWLTREDLAALPASARALGEYGVQFEATPDLRSYKKIIPALKALPEAFVVTADDDVYYGSRWLEELVRGWSGAPGEIVGRRVRKIAFEPDGSPAPYARWRWCYEEGRAGTDLLPVGVGGVLFPPGALSAEVLDESAFLTLCPSADDLWLWWMARRAGSRVRKVAGQRTYLFWPTTQDVGLSNLNRRGGANDAQVRALAERYGVPPRG
jgi:hypothetical protein